MNDPKKCNPKLLFFSIKASSPKYPIDGFQKLRGLSGLRMRRYLRVSFRIKMLR